MAIHNIFLVKNLPFSLQQEQATFVFIWSVLMAFLTLLFSLTNKIPATSFSFLYPSCQTALCLSWGSRGDTSIESDRDWGVRLPAVTAPLLLVQALLRLSYLSQAVIQNPFSNGGSPAGEAVGGETRFAYFPATAVSDGTVSVQAAADPTLTQAGGESVLILIMDWNLPQGYGANLAIILS